MTPSDRAAIAFRDVTKAYSGRLALSGVSFEVRPGARVALLGPNGAGKTTTVRLITGRLRPSRGEISILGVAPTSSEFRGIRARIGIMPQDAGTYADLTVGEYLELARAGYGRSYGGAVVEVLGLGERLDMFMSLLSGGYQRRCVLAGALMADPELLVLDEPTVGLDPVAAHDVRQQLRPRMSERTVVLCTHNLAEAQELCDEVIMLRAGVVVVHDRIAHLRHMAGSRVRITARQPAEVVIAALRHDGVAASADGGSAVCAATSRDAVPGILRALLNAGLDVYDARIEEPDLEDVFLEVMRR